MLQKNISRIELVEEGAKSGSRHAVNWRLQCICIYLICDKRILYAGVCKLDRKYKLGWPVLNLQLDNFTAGVKKC